MNKLRLNKIQIIAISIGILLMIGFAGVSYWTNSKQVTSEANRVLEHVEQVEENHSNGQSSLNITLDENVEELFPNDMSEEEVQTAIHQMSHQKVEAEKKWGALLITQERVDQLYEVVSTNEIKYDHGQVYIRILERWKNGDFSQVDDDHNAIWKLQEGTVGEATGILTTSEEKKFIEEYFK